MIQARFAVHWSAILATMVVPLAGQLAPHTFGEEFRLEVPQLVESYAYGQLRGPVPFDLGWRLASITAIQVVVTGTYTLGWFDGDNVENFYHGPMGSGLWAQMNHSADWALRWSGSTHIGTTGPFSRTISLGPDSGRANLDFLLDGASDLWLEHEVVYSFGGGMTIPPQATITAVTVVVEAERQFKIISFLPGSALSWTHTPTQGVIRVQYSPQPTGSWSTVASTWSSNGCCTITSPPATNAGFYRVVYSQD